MMKEPWFWHEETLAARAIAAFLQPAASAYAGAQVLRRRLTKPAPAPVPVFCVGAATVGGAGKTPFALMLRKIAADLGVDAYFATRGYGGSERGPLRVDLKRHGTADVGDEALLLAAAAPTFVARDRAAGVRAAAGAGAMAVIMDDGFQNPTQEKTLAFLLTRPDDAKARVLPAGRLREPFAQAARRADLVVEIAPHAGAGSSPLWAWLTPEGDIPEKAYAFCGIARPRSFFDLLQRSGCVLAGAVAFPDHHPFTQAELSRLRAAADRAGAPLATTAKDFVRLPHDFRDGVLVVEATMACSAPEQISAAIGQAMRSFQRKRSAHG